MIKNSNYYKYFVPQHDCTDCGPACLLSLIKYYGGDSTLMRLREMSGTNNSGTTLLGLAHAAKEMGFEAEGAEFESVEDITVHGHPCILVTKQENGTHHYIVVYGIEKGLFVLSDPAKGILRLQVDELNAICTRKCLLLLPGNGFLLQKNINDRKRTWVLSLIEDDWGLLLSSMAIGIAISILGMVMAVFSQKLVDEVLPSHDIQKVVAGICLVLILLLFRIIIIALRSKLLLTQSRNFNNRIIHFFLGGIMRLPKMFFDMRKTGDMVSRLEDTRRIQIVIANLIGDVLITIFVITASLLFLLFYSPIIAGVALVACPFLFWVAAMSNHRIALQHKEVMSSFATSQSMFINTIEGITDIKASACEDLFLSINQHFYHNYQKESFSLGCIGVNLGLTAGVVNILAQMSIIATGCILVFKDMITTGELMAIITITSSLLSSLSSLATIMIPINEAKVAFNRMYEMLETRYTNLIKTQSNVSKYHSLPNEVENIEIKGIDFRFVGRPLLLKKLSIKFTKGRITSIVGENGCGKSTLCKILDRLYDSERGEILLNGISSKDINEKDWHNVVSYVPQDTFILNGTVIENICFGTVPSNMDIFHDFCSKYELNDFISSLPTGAFTLVGEEGIDLSGGQKQLIAFARMLWRLSDIIILDEMTTALDSVTEKFICETLLKLKHEHIIIIVTHRLEIARAISDEIAVLSDGELQAFGTHEALMNSENYYNSYWNSLLNKAL